MARVRNCASRQPTAATEGAIAAMQGACGVRCSAVRRTTAPSCWNEAITTAHHLCRVRLLARNSEVLLFRLELISGEAASGQERSNRIDTEGSGEQFCHHQRDIRDEGGLESVAAASGTMRTERGPPLDRALQPGGCPAAGRDSDDGEHVDPELRAALDGSRQDGWPQPWIWRVTAWLVLPWAACLRRDGRVGIAVFVSCLRRALVCDSHRVHQSFVVDVNRVGAMRRDDFCTAFFALPLTHPWPTRPTSPT